MQSSIYYYGRRLQPSRAIRYHELSSIQHSSKLYNIRTVWPFFISNPISLSFVFYESNSLTGNFRLLYMNNILLHQINFKAQTVKSTIDLNLQSLLIVII